MRVLVTGASGYIGSHLVKALAVIGHDVDALDKNMYGQNNIESFVNRSINHDVRLPIEHVREYDAIVHLAAETKVDRSVIDPVLYYNTNISGSFNVANVPHNKFIHCSTGAAINPISSPYAMSKRASEDVIKSMCPQHSICRFFNVSGNDGFKKFDYEHYHLLRRVAATANGIYDHVPINGDDYDTRDGTTIRNYTHVSDIVNALVRIVEAPCSNKIENLGNSKGYSVKEIISIFEKITNSPIPYKVYPRRQGDTVSSVLVEQSAHFIETHDIISQCISSLENEN